MPAKLLTDDTMLLSPILFRLIFRMIHVPRGMH